MVTLKRYRIICSEVAVNGKFLPGKSKYFVKLPEEIEIFPKFSLKNSNFFVKLNKKVDSFRKFAWINRRSF